MRKNRAILLAAGLPAAAFVGGQWVRYRRDIRRERQRVSTGSQIVQTPSGPIEYAIAGLGSPVLFVHGAGGGFDQGLSIGDPLARKGFRIVAMSRFGYLRTPLPADASAEAQADAHAALLDALGIARSAVVGVSAGAPSAMQLALRHPDRVSSLVLLVPGAYAPRPGGAAPVHSARERMPSGTRFLLETMLKSDFLFWAATRLARPVVFRAILGTPPEVVRKADAAEQARVADLMTQILPISARRNGLLNDAEIMSALPRYELESIAVPTLTIGVEDDLYGTCDGARYTAEHVPGARFKQYATGGHLTVGHGEAIGSEIAEFLKGATTSEAGLAAFLPPDASHEPAQLRV
jgi:pimeloyl-ACP methyl ester carboxylesterase